MNPRSTPNLRLSVLLLLAFSTFSVCAQTYLSENFRYRRNGNSATIIGYSLRPSGALVIPATLDGIPVTAIGEEAFDFCTGLTSLTISGGIASIGGGAFHYCRGLISVAIPGSVTSIGANAFLDCFDLKSVAIPDGVVSIGAGAFSSCSSLTSFTIPAGVTRIESALFAKCYRLANVTIPSSVKTIGSSAFKECLDLTSVTIPSDVSIIEAYAFDECGLLSVTIPPRITRIENGVFARCWRLTDVTIPFGVTGIGTFAFNRCDSLTNVAIPSSVVTLSEDAFYNCGLTSAVFLGNAPLAVGSGVFDSVEYGFTVYYLPESSGFTFPLWRGYPSSTLVPPSITTDSPLAPGRAGETYSRTLAATGGVKPYYWSVVGGSLPAGLVLSAAGVIGGTPSEETTAGFTVRVDDSYGQAFTREFSIPVAAAPRIIDLPSAVVTGGGAAPWFAQFSETHDGVDAARSGAISHRQESWLQITVTGPGTLGFWWKVSSEAGYDTLGFHIDGTLRIGPVSGDMDWTRVTCPIASGSHTLRWRYAKDGAFSFRSDAGWVDQMTFTPGGDPLSTPNGDGVSLLMAYALNLDPSRNQSASMPEAILAGDRLSMSFYGGREDVTYTVRASADQQTWTTAGVTLSTPDGNGMRTASIPITGGSRYLRLEVSQQ